MPAADGAGSVADRGTERRVDLYLRDGVPAAIAGTVESTMDRVARLVDAGVVTEYGVKQWPPSCGDEDGFDEGPSTRRERVRAFRAWAEKQGYSLEPGFEVRTVTTTMVGRTANRERVSVPLLTLAYYEDGDLEGVAPCTDGARTYTVPDCLTALETGDGFPLAETTPDRGDGPAVRPGGAAIE